MACTNVTPGPPLTILCRKGMEAGPKMKSTSAISVTNCSFDLRTRVVKSMIPSWPHKRRSALPKVSSGSGSRFNLASGLRPTGNATSSLAESRRDYMREPQLLAHLKQVCIEAADVHGA